MNQKRLLFQQPTTDADVLNAFRSTEECLTRREICERIFRKKTPSMIARISRLADEGYLLATATRLPNGVDMFCYTYTGFDDSMPF